MSARGKICAALALLALLVSCAPVAHAQSDFLLFESDPVRPLAFSPDGRHLFVTNIPDNRLEIFAVASGGAGAGVLTHVSSVPVGMEPVAVAARSNDEVWVVNHLSDSVSVVDSSSSPPHVARTLLVGDEPRDIVFAGSDGKRAFISSAHRGQHSPFPRSEYDKPGVGRADVWVFDAENPGTSLGGDALAVVTLFGERARALAVSADGGTVFAAAFRSGNRTAAVHESRVCDGGASASPCLPVWGGTASPGGLPAPDRNALPEDAPAPEVGLIVRKAGPSDEWQDELGRDWSASVRFDLPDRDVFAIDANADPPVESGFWSGVGTILFNMIAHPTTGRIYVSNTEARNEVRFEGPGIVAAAAKPASEPASVRGHLHEARITVLDGADVIPRHLNKHIPYGASPVPDGVREKSLATPMQMALDGDTLYVAAFGSSKIGVFDVNALRDDSFTPDTAAHIPVAGGGPAGIAVRDGHLYVYTRFDNAVAAIDLATRSEIDREALPNPEPASVVAGRPNLYDAVFTSGNGEASCAACHVFGDLDDLAWDLGNPDEQSVPNDNPNKQPILGPLGPFHPMKGPMTTQSLRGLEGAGPQHWRGDRQGNALDAFLAFDGAFDGLLGRDEGPLPTADMQALAEFALQIRYPPNPIRRLDNSLRPDEAAGREIFLNRPASDVITECKGCHTLDASAGFFGSDGGSTFEGESQEFKIPHLRNAYQKIGMFGQAETPGLGAGGGGLGNDHQGDQVRGFGFLHDGSIDTLFRFMSGPGFQINDDDRADLEAFTLAFDSDLAPIVGQQITRTAQNAATVDAHISLLVARAAADFDSRILGGRVRECELIAKAHLGSVSRGYVRRDSGLFESDDGTPALGDAQLRALADTPGNTVTYTCAPPGSGQRMGIDRDRDGAFDGVDNCPARANGAQADFDGDGAGDACDRCPRAADAAGQPDTGGVGEDSAPDGISDACQCGDLGGDGRVEASDVESYRAHLADPVGSPLAAQTRARCAVSGATACGILEVIHLSRALAGAAPPLEQSCSAAQPL